MEVYIYPSRMVWPAWEAEKVLWWRTYTLRLLWLTIEVVV
jgi:hypothetical protein